MKTHYFAATSKVKIFHHIYFNTKHGNYFVQQLLKCKKSVDGYHMQNNSSIIELFWQHF